MRRAYMTLAACVVAAGSASAQEVYVDDWNDDEAYVEEPAYVETPAYEEEVPVEDGIVVGPRVYGWTVLQPANCGTFKYWNGEYCADARYDLPEE
ncbi:hypothetical protein [Hyphomicrobium sp.]|uniref:hypothetical protein n=1 Tax=Hyphomicrobium sp. TaxID=82 RepID=UPI0025C223DD|nr:hypothetical protein [Hyphomicrobium sp.]MCC7254208.1 hypothetical protein [Hyphomicrobium sp.]